jgi:lipoic acid synthetase
MVTIGQYLRPDTGNLPVSEFVSPEIFRKYEQMALSMGFRSAHCGPFVRSSYNADELLKKCG